VHEVNELVKPTDEALELVHDWLSDAGIETASLSYSLAKDRIKVTIPVNEVETLLNTEYSDEQWRPDSAD
jgi:tripeptidyl-peptidase-1